MELFGAEHANVQPHSGTQANMAVYFSVMNPGDTYLGMDLRHGGHLSMGHPKNFSGTIYRVIPYSVRSDDHRIDYDQVRDLARKPQASNDYCRRQRVSQDHRLRSLCRNRAAKWTRLLMVDMAHIAGLVVADVHPSPVFPMPIL